MPAMLDDPTRPTIYRTSGALPYPGPDDPLPPSIHPRQVTLRDRITIATLVPFSSPDQVPPSLLAYVCDQFNREIEKGDTYPMMDPLPRSTFGTYWFGNFGAVMLLGEIERVEDVQEGKDWAKECLGSFYIKPNYPGRSSHVCNGGFLVTDAARNRGVGRLMGEGYLEWAPMLGYTYSVFNLVYESNVASCRIWDALGFKRIGRVKGCGNLKSYPDQLIDAIIYGRDLGPEGEDFVSEERFDKIKFYLKHGKYPNGADRAEKSRLRSAATHYKLLDDDRLMLKDKEVIPDAQKQYEIARSVHLQQHGGINKTTATIAEKYHWVRIKETVSLVIRNCNECKELAKAPVVRADSNGASNGTGNGNGNGVTKKPVNGAGGGSSSGGVSAAGRVLSLPSKVSSKEKEQQQKQQEQEQSSISTANLDVDLDVGVDVDVGLDGMDVEVEMASSSPQMLSSSQTSSLPSSQGSSSRQRPSQQQQQQQQQLSGSQQKHQRLSYPSSIHPQIIQQQPPPPPPPPPPRPTTTTEAQLSSPASHPHHHTLHQYQAPIANMQHTLHHHHPRHQLQAIHPQHHHVAVVPPTTDYTSSVTTDIPLDPRIIEMESMEGVVPHPNHHHHHPHLTQYHHHHPHQHPTMGNNGLRINHHQHAHHPSIDEDTHPVDVTIDGDDDDDVDEVVVDEVIQRHHHRHHHHQHHHSQTTLDPSTSGTGTSNGVGSGGGAAGGGGSTGVMYQYVSLSGGQAW